MVSLFHIESVVKRMSVPKSKTHTNSHGIIMDGKYAGQPRYAPYFWKQAQDGLADARRGNVLIFDIQKKDIKEYPELSRFEIVTVSADKQGFVTVEACDDDEA
jgi:hypothetical protein